MKYTDFQKELKSGVSGSYVFYGPEAYLKRYALRSVRQLIIPDEAAEFNRFVFDESNFKVDLLYDVMQTVSFTAEQKLIEISGPIFKGITEEELESLCAALKTAAEYDTVIIVYTNEDEFDAGTTNKPSALMKALSAVSKPVFFEKEPPAKLIRWIQRHFASEGITASPQTCNSLLENCSRDMFALSNEIAKLSAYIKCRCPNDPQLTEEDIFKLSSRNNEFEAYAFSDALMSGDKVRAMSVLNEMKADKERPEIILGSVAGIACDLYTIKLLCDTGMTKAEIASKLNMNDFRAGLYIKRVSKLNIKVLRRFTEACYSADIKIKHSPSDSYEILDRLVAENIQN